jgi:hypothetical protein
VAAVFLARPEQKPDADGGTLPTIQSCTVAVTQAAPKKPSSPQNR